MSQNYEHVQTTIETINAEGNFKLYLTSHHGGRKPLLLGMHLSYRDNYTTPTVQASNRIRSGFRKFGNDYLSKIAPNDFFSVDQRTIEGKTYKSLYCKFIKDEKVYLDILQAHEMTQAWDQLMNQYDLRRLFSSQQIVQVAMGPNHQPIKYFAGSAESDEQNVTIKLPLIVDEFLKIIVNTEKI